MKKIALSTLAVAACAVAFAWASPAAAKVTTYGLTLDGKQETPPNTSAGSGTGTVTYDDATKEMTYTITYSGLTGPATAAHFHGPAAAGAAAGVVVGVTGSVASPITGKATLTDGQAKDLADGMLYFNVHTAANPKGEIRGQVLAKP
jgi:hypothetical protein